MRVLAAAAICVLAMGASAPTLAQYGGYGGGGRGGYDDGYRDRGGGGRARGSFYATCRGIDQDGPILRAMCRTRDGDYAPARIDVRRCGGAPIANVDGRLRC